MTRTILDAMNNARLEKARRERIEREARREEIRIANEKAREIHALVWTENIHAQRDLFALARAVRPREIPPANERRPHARPKLSEGRAPPLPSRVHPWRSPRRVHA